MLAHPSWLALLLPWFLAPLRPAPRDAASDPLRERSRAHYEAVRDELLARPPRDLSEAQLRARKALIATLEAYRERGDFTRNTDFPGARVPYFVDREGRLCAVATLLQASGEGELVNEVARRNNHVWVSELSGEERFSAWLARVGLTFDEAVRIQGPGAVAQGGNPPQPPRFDPGRIVPGGPVPAPAGGPVPGGEGAPSGPRPTRPASGPSLGLGPASGPVFASPRSPERDPEAIEEGWMTWWDVNKLRWLEPELEAEVPADGDGTRPESARESLRRGLVPRLRAELANAQAEVRSAAAFAYARAAEGAAVPELTTLFTDPSLGVRESAILALGVTDSEAGVHALLSLLRRKDPPSPRARALAVVALGAARLHGRGLGTDGMLAPLLDSLVELDGDDVLHAALLYQTLAPSEALARRVRCASGRFREPCASAHERATAATRARALETLRFDPEPARVLPRLLDAVHGRVLEERRSAAGALAGVNGSLDALLTAAELEEEPFARGTLLISIGEQGGDRAREFLVRRLVKGRQNEFPWAALGLGILAREAEDAEARTALRAAWKGARASEREVLLLALGLARDAAAHDTMAGALVDGHSDRQRMFAAVGLGLSGDPAGRETLLQAIATVSCPYARAGLALALALQREPADTARLMRLLCDERRPESLRDLALVLGLQGSQATLAGLVPLLDEDLPVSVHAATLDALGLALTADRALAFTRLGAHSNPSAWPAWVHELGRHPF